MVKCKTLGCNCHILLAKNADVEKYRYPLEALPPDTVCADWDDACPECQQRHRYSKNLVFSAVIDLSKAGAGWGSSAFRKACGDEGKVKVRAI
jgi:hypothetical protein